MEIRVTFGGRGNGNTLRSADHRAYSELIDVATKQRILYVGPLSEQAHNNYQDIAHESAKELASLKNLPKDNLAIR